MQQDIVRTGMVESMKKKVHFFIPGRQGEKGERRMERNLTIKDHCCSLYRFDLESKAGGWER